MLQAIFEWLYNSLQSGLLVALAASLIWGILSILLSPCHLASIPLIVGFINAQGRISNKKAFIISLLFSSGILITIAIIGLITGLLGRMMGDIGCFGNYIVAIIFLVVGLYLLEIIRIPFLSNISQPRLKKRGLLACFLLGLFFGLALGPCTFAYMAPMLAIVFNFTSDRFIFGVMLLIFYGIGHCSVIVLAGTFTEVLQRYLNWNERSKGAVILKKICGVLVILGGIYLIWSC